MNLGNIREGLITNIRVTEPGSTDTAPVGTNPVPEPAPAICNFPVGFGLIDLNNKTIDENFDHVKFQFNRIKNKPGCIDNLDLSNPKIKRFMDNLVGLMDHVKKLNNQKMKNFQEKISEIENNIGGSGIRDINKLEDDETLFNKVSTMNKDQMVLFIDKYFYLIVKIIFVLLIFYLLYTRSSFGIGISLTGVFSNLFNKANETVNKTTESVQKLGVKVGDLEKKQKLKEKIKRPQKNSNVNSSSGKTNTTSSSTGFGSAKPKFGTSLSEKDILTQSLNKV